MITVLTSSLKGKTVQEVIRATFSERIFTGGAGAYRL